MNTSEVLNGAADHISVFGHHKGRAVGNGPWPSVPACTVGAIVIASEYDYVGQKQAIDAMVTHLRNGVIDWNDAPERTAEQVIEALRAAAVIEAAKEVDVRVVEPRVAVG